MNGQTPQEVTQWITANDLCLAIFTTPDCGVCNAIKPKVAELAGHYPTLQVRYLDISDSPELAGAHNVFVVPVLVLFVQRREAVRFARYFGMHELESAVDRYASLLDDT
ncbi:MAG: thioredoxin [Spirochaetales bacterium]|nr:MAG: thioredoxin [Spirochaetales bacterium]